MKVLILGGSGRLGRHLITEGVRVGHQITALVRKKESVAPTGDRLTIREGDALTPDTIDRITPGRDVIIYAMKADRGNEAKFYADSTRLLLNAMQKHSVKRLIAVTCMGVGHSKGHGGFFYDNIAYPFFFREDCEAKERQETLIRSSELDWVVVRPAFFWGEKKGGAVKASINLSGVAHSHISLGDAAKFIIGQVESDTWLRKTPVIGY